jgi:tetratricopeptide (TPR) repeat protein
MRLAERFFNLAVRDKRIKELEHEFLIFLGEFVNVLNTLKGSGIKFFIGIADEPVQEVISPERRIIFLKTIADSLYRRDEYALAIRYFDTLVQLDPNQGEYYYKRGFSYDQIYKRPEVPQAIENYLKSIQFGYRKADSYDNLGLSYMFVNDSLSATYFEKSLKIKPDNQDIITFLEQSRLRMKKKASIHMEN